MFFFFFLGGGGNLVVHNLLPSKSSLPHFPPSAVPPGQPPSNLSPLRSKHRLQHCFQPFPTYFPPQSLGI